MILKKIGPQGLMCPHPGAIYVGCSESSCNFVITLLIFIHCTKKMVCVNFIVDRKMKEK